MRYPGQLITLCVIHTSIAKCCTSYIKLKLICNEKTGYCHQASIYIFNRNSTCQTIYTELTILISEIMYFFF